MTQATIDQKTFRVNLSILATLIIGVGGCALYLGSLRTSVEAKIDSIGTSLMEVKAAVTTLTQATIAGDRDTAILSERQRMILQRLDAVEARVKALESR